MQEAMRSDEKAVIVSIIDKWQNISCYLEAVTQSIKNVLLPDMRWKVSAKEPSSLVLQVFTAAESFLISGEVLREWSAQCIGLGTAGRITQRKHVSYSFIVMHKLQTLSYR